MQRFNTPQLSCGVLNLCSLLTHMQACPKEQTGAAASADSTLPDFPFGCLSRRKRPRNGAYSPMLTQIILVENNCGSVRIFKPLLRLEGVSQNITVDDSGLKISQILIHIGLKHKASFALLNLHKHSVLLIHQLIFLVNTRLGAVKVSVAVNPYRKM